jgi:hypothetical protein
MLARLTISYRAAACLGQKALIRNWEVSDRHKSRVQFLLLCLPFLFSLVLSLHLFFFSSVIFAFASSVLSS